MSHLILRLVGEDASRLPFVGLPEASSMAGKGRFQDRALVPGSCYFFPRSESDAQGS